MEAKFKPGESEDIIIPIHKHLSTDAIIERLNRKLENGYIKSKYSTIHIDIAHEVNTRIYILHIIHGIQPYIVVITPKAPKDFACIIWSKLKAS